jgi:hypothetical protein
MRIVSLPVPVVIELPPLYACTVSVPPVAVSVSPVPPMKIMWSPEVALIMALLTVMTGLASLAAICCTLCGDVVLVE